MQCFRSLCAEFVSLNKLSAYSMIANAVDASFNLSTIIILGQLGKGHLSAGVIALAIYNISWYFYEGMLTAQDNLVSRAFALKDRKTARYWSYIACGVSIIFLIPTTILFIFAAVVVQYAFSIRPHTASKAAEFLILLLPGFWCQALFRIQQKYLQCQKQMRLPLICGIIGAVCNIVVGYLLSFTFGLGFPGCGIATTAARVVMLVAMFSAICKVEDITIAVEEVTRLGQGMRHRYLDANMDEVRSEDGGDRRVKATAAPSTAGGRSSGRKGLKLGRKVRIAPIAGESQHGDVEPASPSGEVEMVNLHAREDVVVQEESPLHSSGAGGVDRQLPSGGTTATTGNRVTSERTAIDETAAILEVEEGGGDGGGDAEAGDGGGGEGDDTVSLIRSPESTELRRTGKTVAADTLRFLFLGIPGGLVLGAEFWLFEVLIVAIAHMGSISVGTMQMFFTITNFIFLSLPFAISIAGTVQISKQLARKRHRRARMVAYLCLIEGTLFMTLAAGLQYLLRDYIGYIFTGNEDLIARLKSLAPFCAGFQVAYGIFGAAQGVMRATSHQLEMLGWTVLALWLVGTPVGFYLAFVTRPTYGLTGIWIGLIVGMGLLAAVMVFQVFMLDWEKEARKAVYRLRVSGAAALEDYSRSGDRTSGSRRAAMEEGMEEEHGIVMNPIGGARRGSARRDSAAGGASLMGPVAMPTIGSRAVGGFPVDALFRTAEEDLAELEFIEFGEAAASGAGGGDTAIEVGPTEDDGQYKRAD